MYLTITCILFPDIQSRKPRCFCPRCGGERYGSLPCLRCEGRGL